MGKTAGNAVWLDPNKTSPFEFYQYWRNVDDADVLKCIRMLTFLPLEQIDEMSTWKDQRLNEAKEILAYELTKLVHGEEEANKAQEAARALFGGSAWVSTSAYFIGMAAIIVSGIMLKKTKMFAGDPAPFVMELPAYHWPTLGNVLRSMWERGWSFIKKAGTIILLSTIFVWFTTYFGFVDGTFRMLGEEEIDYSILAAIGGVLAWVFKPLGWGNWQAAVASITGLVAKENIVGTLGILYGGGDGTVYQNLANAFNGITGYSFLVFNLLCAPCFAAIGAIKREMNNAKWTWFAIGYQCGFAYIIALMINQFGNLFTGHTNVIGLVFALAALAGMLYMLFKPYKEATKLSKV